MLLKINPMILVVLYVQTISTKDVKESARNQKVVSLNKRQRVERDNHTTVELKVLLSNPVPLMINVLGGIWDIAVVVNAEDFFLAMKVENIN